MSAARRDRYGSPDVIRVDQIDRPTPTDEQVLVRVCAATVSRTDCALLAAQPFFMRFLAGLFSPSTTAENTVSTPTDCGSYCPATTTSGSNRGQMAKFPAVVLD